MRKIKELFNYRKRWKCQKNKNKNLRKKINKLSSNVSEELKLNVTNEEIRKLRFEIDRLKRLVIKSNQEALEYFDLLMKKDTSLLNPHVITIEEHKNYYKNATKKQILEDTYIDYCNYINILKEKFEWVILLDRFKDQQKEFINYLNNYIELLNDKPDLLEEKQKEILEEILEKYREIIVR